MAPDACSNINHQTTLTFANFILLDTKSRDSYISIRRLTPVTTVTLSPGHLAFNAKKEPQ